MIDKKNTVNLTKYAINYLSKFSSSKANLKRILTTKIRNLQIEKKEKYLLYNSIDQIIEKLEKNNFINDLNYVSSKIRNFAIMGKSKMFIKSYFLKKGIEKDLIFEIFNEYDFNNPEWEIKSAKIFARKKNFIKNADDKKKNLSKMARAGFNYETSIKILEDI